MSVINRARPSKGVQAHHNFPMNRLPYDLIAGVNKILSRIEVVQLQYVRGENNE